MAFMASNYRAAGGSQDSDRAILEGLEVTADRIADLMEADQRIENGFLTFYRAGSADVLMRKAVAGTTCSDNVSLIDG